MGYDIFLRSPVQHSHVYFRQGAVVLGSQSAVQNSGVQVGSTTASIVVGMYSVSTGSPIMVFDHTASGNTGEWRFRNGSTPTAVAQITSTGDFRGVGISHRLGLGALGATGGYFDIVTDSGANVIINAQHSGSDANWVARTKGNGGFYVQNAAGTVTPMSIDTTVINQVNVNKLNVSGATTTTTAPGAGGAGALPATPLGYVTIQILSVDRKIAYY